MSRSCLTIADRYIYIHARRVKSNMVPTRCTRLLLDGSGLDFLGGSNHNNNSGVDQQGHRTASASILCRNWCSTAIIQALVLLLFMRARRPVFFKTHPLLGFELTANNETIANKSGAERPLPEDICCGTKSRPPTFAVHAPSFESRISFQEIYLSQQRFRITTKDG